MYLAVMMLSQLPRDVLHGDLYLFTGHLLDLVAAFTVRTSYAASTCGCGCAFACTDTLTCTSSSTATAAATSVHAWGFNAAVHGPIPLCLLETDDDTQRVECLSSHCLTWYFDNVVKRFSAVFSNFCLISALILLVPLVTHSDQARNMFSERLSASAVVYILRTTHTAYGDVRTAATWLVYAVADVEKVYNHGITSSFVSLGVAGALNMMFKQPCYFQRAMALAVSSAIVSRLPYRLTALIIVTAEYLDCIYDSLDIRHDTAYAQAALLAVASMCVVSVRATPALVLQLRTVQNAFLDAKITAALTDILKSAYRPLSTRLLAATALATCIQDNVAAQLVVAPLVLGALSRVLDLVYTDYDEHGRDRIEGLVCSLCSSNEGVTGLVVKVLLDTLTLAEPRYCEFTTRRQSHVVDLLAAVRVVYSKTCTFPMPGIAEDSVAVAELQRIAHPLSTQFQDSVKVMTRLLLRAGGVSASETAHAGTRRMLQDLVIMAPTSCVLSSHTSTLCSVCHDSEDAARAVVCVPCCGNTFHLHCMETWLVRARPGDGTCPLCRQPAPQPPKVCPSSIII